MNDQNESARIDGLFEQTIDLPTDRWTTFLDEQCGQDADLRIAVEARLRAYERVGKDTEFLEPMGTNLAELSPGAVNIRCPHCQNAIEILKDCSFDHLQCGKCGSHLNVLTNRDSEIERVLPKNLQHFRLIEKLGTGSFGTVWKAEDTELHRMVAIKIPRKLQLERDDEELFLREARVAASLRHPNIVTVHEIGRDETLYIVSDLIEGHSLEGWAQSARPNIREIVEICIQVARGLEYAHSKGVIHRDLKPANILVDKEGIPHITDFGLAKREAGEITMTIAGQILGTPAYMSPEQAEGNAKSADRRSDVYSLGVILYELLCDRLPFEGSAAILLHQVIASEIPLPRKFNPKIPRDLETICLKALSKSTESRYESASDFADDLKRCIDFQPIRAKRVSRLRKLVIWSKRHRRAVLLNTVIGAACVIATFAGIAGWRAYSAKDIAILQLTGNGMSEAIVRDSHGLEVKRLAVPTPEPVELASGEYQLETVSREGWSHFSRISLKGKQRNKFKLSAEWPFAFSEFRMSPGNVRIVDRLGVLHESSTGVSLYQWTGEKVWSTELAEPDLPELKYSNDRWVVNTVLNATDLNEDGSDDLLIGFKCSSRRSELQLFAVSMLDGSLIWTSKLTVDTFGSDPAYLSARRVATLASPSNTLVISGKENYTGLSIRTGEVVWSREVRSGHEFMFLDSARIAAVTDRSHLSVLAAATGQTKHEVDVPIGWRTGGIVEIDGRQSLLGMSWDAIEVRSLVNLTVEKTLEWHKLIELSDVATSGDIYTVIAPDLDGDSQRDLFVVYFRVLPSSTDFRRLSEIRIAQRQTSDPNYTLNNERKAILSRSPRKCTLYAFSTRDFNKLYSRDLLPVISPLQSSPRVVDETYLSIADMLFSFAGEAISRLPSNMHETYADADGKVDYAAISRGRNETTVRIFRGCRPPIWQTLATNAHTTEDLNGDGVLDLVGVRKIEPIVVEEQITDVRKSFSLEAISGADGQRLWEYGPLPIQFWRGTTDLDGDSCCDLLIGTCNDSDATNGLIDSVIAISGKTGRKIWRSAAFAGESPMGNIQFSLSIDVDPYRSGHRHVQVTKIEQAQEKRLIVGIRYATMSKDRTHPIQQQWLRVCLQAESGKTLWRAVAAASLVPEPGFDAAAYSDFWIHGPDSYGTQQKRSQILLDDKDCILEVDDEYGARIYDVARGETQWEGILSDEMYRKRGASSRHGTPLRRKRVALNCKLTPPNGGTEYDLVLTTNGQWFVLDGQAKTVKSGEFDDTVNQKVEKQEGKLRITVASENHSDSGQRWELSDPGGEFLGIVKHAPIPWGVFCVGDIYSCRDFHMPE